MTAPQPTVPDDGEAAEGEKPLNPERTAEGARNHPDPDDDWLSYELQRREMELYYSDQQDGRHSGRASLIVVVVAVVLVCAMFAGKWDIVEKVVLLLVGAVGGSYIGRAEAAGGRGERR